MSVSVFDDSQAPFPKSRMLSPPSMRCWLMQVIILLRPARVQVQYTAPTAAHLSGVLQHVENMLAEITALQKQLQGASIAPQQG